VRAEARSARQCHTISVLCNSMPPQIKPQGDPPA
jgi:hypothetical protein